MLNVLFVHRKHRRELKTRYAGDLDYHSTRAAVVRAGECKRFLLGTGKTLEDARSAARETSQAKILEDFPLKGGIGYMVPQPTPEPVEAAVAEEAKKPAKKTTAKSRRAERDKKKSRKSTS